MKKLFLSILMCAFWFSVNSQTYEMIKKDSIFILKTSTIEKNQLGLMDTIMSTQTLGTKEMILPVLDQEMRLRKFEDSLMLVKINAMLNVQTTSRNLLNTKRANGFVISEVLSDEYDEKLLTPFSEKYDGSYVLSIIGSQETPLAYNLISKENRLVNAENDSLGVTFVPYTMNSAIFLTKDYSTRLIYFPQNKAFVSEDLQLVLTRREEKE